MPDKVTLAGIERPGVNPIPARRHLDYAAARLARLVQELLEYRRAVRLSVPHCAGLTDVPVKPIRLRPGRARGQRHQDCQTTQAVALMS